MKNQQVRGKGIRELVLLSVCTALIFSGQIALSALPNIEIVSLLILLYTRWFKNKALLIICAFVLLEGIFYGFHFWWIGYLYIWTILWFVVRICDTKPRSAFYWASIGGGFGLFFGLLYSLSYFVIGGWSMAFSWWISGIIFDVIHCIGNFAIILVLFHPLNRVYEKIAKQ